MIKAVESISTYCRRSRSGQAWRKSHSWSHSSRSSERLDRHCVIEPLTGETLHTGS